MKVVIDDKIPFIRGAFEPYADVRYIKGADIRREDLLDADALVVRTRTLCDKTLLEGTSVKAIASATIGYDHIDGKWCESNGIRWSNAPGCNSSSVAQYIICALCVEYLKRGWNFSDKTLGVVGAGHVGSKVLKMASALGFKTLACDPPRAALEGDEGFVGLERLLLESDIVSLHVPLDESTFHLIGSKTLALLDEGKILFNSSRGPVVDNAALKDCLSLGRLGGAVLDVWEEEPRLDRNLALLCDISTPHIAGYSADGKMNGSAASVRFVSKILGLPLTEWEGQGLPEAPQPDIYVDASSMSFEKAISEAMLSTYDILSDSNSLRNDFAAFEALRGDYHIRREPCAYRVHLENADGTLSKALSELGFNLI